MLLMIRISNDVVVYMRLLIRLTDTIVVHNHRHSDRHNWNLWVGAVLTSLHLCTLLDF